MYKLICNISLEGDDKDCIFASAFITVELNLMSCEKFVDCCAEILVGQRMPLVFISLEKRLTNLRGGVMLYGMFMLHHQILPAILVILHLLAICLQNLESCSIMILPGGPKKLLFPDSNQYECFIKVFHRVMCNSEEASQCVRVVRGDLRLH